MSDLKQQTIQFEGGTYIHDTVVKALVGTNEKLQARVQELEEAHKLRDEINRLLRPSGWGGLTAPSKENQRQALKLSEKVNKLVKGGE